MVQRGGKQARPQIHLYHHPEAAGELLEHICAGIEEEGVPYLREVKEEGEAVPLAYQAAQDSKLGVGIGLDAGGGAALHYYRLDPGHPLFSLGGGGVRTGQGRVLGSNAARLIKGTPFKPWEEPEDIGKRQPASPGQEETDRELIRRIVTSILGREGAG